MIAGTFESTCTMKRYDMKRSRLVLLVGVFVVCGTARIGFVSGVEGGGENEAQQTTTPTPTTEVEMHCSAAEESVVEYCEDLGDENGVHGSGDGGEQAQDGRAGPVGVSPMEGVEPTGGGSGGSCIPRDGDADRDGDVAGGGGRPKVQRPTGSKGKWRCGELFW